LNEKPSLQSKFTLLKSSFFPLKFPFPKFKRKIWREKIYFAKERSHIEFVPGPVDGHRKTEGVA
jgi:hypothetical protein